MTSSTSTPRLAGDAARLLEHRAAALEQRLLVVVDLAAEPADLVGEDHDERSFSSAASATAASSAARAPSVPS